MPTCKEKVLAKFPSEEDLGTYITKTGGTRVELHIKTKLAFLAVIDPGEDMYFAEARFYDVITNTNDPNYKPDNEICEPDDERPRLALKYSHFGLKRIFDFLRMNESEIENLLGRHNWMTEREVLSCVLSLEEKTRHLYESRKTAKEERNLIVYGTRETPQKDD